MFIRVKTFDRESSPRVECFSYIKVDMIESIEPELCDTGSSTFYNDDVTVISTTEHYFYTFLSCEDILELIKQEKHLEASEALSSIPFFGGRKK